MYSDEQILKNKSEKKRLPQIFIYFTTHTFIYFTQADWKNAQFMVTGCLWGERVEKRTEKVNKEGLS